MSSNLLGVLLAFLLISNTVPAQLAGLSKPVIYPSQSPSVQQAVQSETRIQCPTTANQNSSITCTVSVTPSSATGLVDFNTTSGGSRTQGDSCTLSGGSCSELFPNLYRWVAGCTLQIVAVYQGDNATLASGSLPADVGITNCSLNYLGETDTTIVSCADPVVEIGNITTCTATVVGYTGSVNGDQIVFSPNGLTGPIGTFYDYTCVISGDSCTAVFHAFTPRTPGVVVISAVYQGGGSYGNQVSIGDFVIRTVSNVTARTSVSTSCPVAINETSNFSCKVTVTPSTASGSVLFETASGQLLTTNHTCTLSVGSCEGNFRWGDVGGGNAVDVIAIYQGSSNLEPSESPPVRIDVAGFSSICSVSSSNGQVTVTKFCLPSGTIPVGISYSVGFVYYASFIYGLIMRVNVTSGNYTYFTKPTGSYNRNYYASAVDGSGDIWLTRRDAPNSGTFGPGVSMISAQTGSEIMVLNSTTFLNSTTSVRTLNGTKVSCMKCFSWDGVGYVGGYVYAASGDHLFRIGETGAVNVYNIAGGGVSYFGFVGDKSGNVWFSNLENGVLFRFNPTNSSIKEYPGFFRPLSLAVLGSTVYVAENCQGGGGSANGTSSGPCAPAIAQISTSGGAIARTPVVGSPYGILSVNGSIIWSSDAEDSGHTTTICKLGGPCVDTGEANYFLTSDSSGRIYAGYYGSSGVLMVTGLSAAVGSSVTSTTSSVSSLVTSKTATSSTTSIVSANESNGTPPRTANGPFGLGWPSPAIIVLGLFLTALTIIVLARNVKVKK